jgi:MFS family permease
LAAVRVGLALSVGPLVATLAGVPAGRIVDRFGPGRITVTGLVGLACGASALSMMPTVFGVMGYVTPIGVMTASYALFQAANNTTIMTAAGTDQRGVVAGLLNLSRHLGLITGASVMGAVFALASASVDITTARPEAIAAGMRSTFAIAALLIVMALGVAVKRRSLFTSHSR